MTTKQAAAPTTTTAKARATRVSAVAVLAVVAAIPLGACGIDQGGLLEERPAGPPSAFGGALDAAADAPDAAAARDNAPDAARDESSASPPDSAAPDPSPDAAADGTTSSACDLDGDGHPAISCGGDDCCDLDADAYPRTTSAWFARATRCGTFDFDCDGRAIRRYVEASCTQGGFACSGEGFAARVPCGVDGLWERCAWKGPGACEPDITTAVTRSQECR